MRYGFIGLGAMGQHMARNINSKMAKRDTLSVFDLVKERATVGTLAASPLAVAQQADTIVTSLPEGRHVRSAFAEMLGGLKGAPRKLFIDTSTIDIETSREMAGAAEAAGHAYVDAPVSGGTTGAKNGTLTFMVGAKDLDSVRPTLEMMGKRLFACGPQSSGLAAKLANNYILALTSLATSEGFRLAEQLGLNMKTFSDVVNASSGQSWSSTVNNPVPGVDGNTPSSRDYEGGFAVDLCKKDLNLAVAAAGLVDLRLPLGRHGPQVYQELSDSGLGQKDFSVLYHALKASA